MVEEISEDVLSVEEDFYLAGADTEEINDEVDKAIDLFLLDVEELNCVAGCASIINFSSDSLLEKKKPLELAFVQAIAKELMIDDVKRSMEAIREPLELLDGEFFDFLE